MLLLSRFMVSDSVRPHRRQPTRLLCPWDSPGKNTGVGCHFLLQFRISWPKMSVNNFQIICVCVWLFGTPWTVAHQAPLSLELFRQEHWSRLPFLSPMHESEKWKWSRSVVSNSSWPMDCSLPDSSVHGILQARVLEWGAIVFSTISFSHSPIQILSKVSRVSLGFCWRDLFLLPWSSLSLS